VLVVDTSAVLTALVVREPAPGLIERLSEDGDLHAPHLIDVEMLHALRRMNARGELTDERAADARSDFRELALVRYPHRELSDRIWELRHNLTAYDAAFVALAESLEAPLVTCDARTARVPGVTAEVELFLSGRPAAGGSTRAAPG
jgi:predicted nucleic acid-binding protein